MSPKAWSNKVTITQKQIQEIVVANQKSLERLAWKGMDPMEFTEAFLPLLKSIAAHSVRIKKVDFGSAVRKCKTSLTSAEIDLLTEKVSTSIYSVKKRLRDAGSGAFLPAAVISMRKAWKKHETKPKAKKEIVKEDKPSDTNLPQTKDVEDIEQDMDKAPTDDIRNIFGLPQKAIMDKIDLLSSSSDQDWVLHKVGPPKDGFLDCLALG